MLVSLLVASLPLIAAYLYNRVRYYRFRQHAALPQFPPSLIWGHMTTMATWIKKGKPDRHIGALRR
jgi:hypothetical protein